MPALVLAPARLARVAHLWFFIARQVHWVVAHECAHIKHEDSVSRALSLVAPVPPFPSLRLFPCCPPRTHTHTSFARFGAAPALVHPPPAPRAPSVPEPTVGLRCCHCCRRDSCVSTAPAVPAAGPRPHRLPRHLQAAVAHAAATGRGHAAPRAGADARRHAAVWARHAVVLGHLQQACAGVPRRRGTSRSLLVACHCHCPPGQQGQCHGARRSWGSGRRSRWAGSQPDPD